ncbi:unnamed protein product [Brassica oleracea]|uniref:(rape) hypothetical protein n=1 Tax=Brassica napus TaxID=3708 RepID=A0A816Q7E7_BRANA|nr:unnamed protein product [Brassica napus]
MGSIGSNGGTKKVHSKSDTEGFGQGMNQGLLQVEACMIQGPLQVIQGSLFLKSVHMTRDKWLAYESCCKKKG